MKIANIKSNKWNKLHSWINKKKYYVAMKSKYIKSNYLIFLSFLIDGLTEFPKLTPNKHCES
jgi:hypothetical protein